MRQNIMAVLVEADAITRELWGLLNEEEVAGSRSMTRYVPVHQRRVSACLRMPCPGLL